MALELCDGGVEASSDIAAHYLAEEEGAVRELARLARLSPQQRGAIQVRAANLAGEIRGAARKAPLLDALLQEYDLSTAEGVALMRLAEALIRTPDFPTARMLTRDKLINRDWAAHAGESPHVMVNLATGGLGLAQAWVRATGGAHADALIARLGDRVLHAAVTRAMEMMGEHFVLGRTIEEAVARAHAAEAGGRITHSYDMLGEAAHTAADASRYFDAYMAAAEHLAGDPHAERSIETAPGLSVKLSALHPRYEYAQRDRCVPVLVERVAALATVAKRAGFGLTIDAEEADRLEVSLLVLEPVLSLPSLDGWDGLGFVVQAYQRRAAPVVRHLIAAARAAGRRLQVRLVKGAYWDTEIKRAQEMGLASYPVFTRKENTDVSYLACARLLLDAPDVVFPKFATHNAHTAAAVAAMAGQGAQLEFQRLHGMGAPLHDALAREYDARTRIYAPVGEHKDLLPYLVRRLLENGANSSFVHQLLDRDASIDSIVRDPLAAVEGNATAAHPAIPAPRDLFAGARLAAEGLDLTQANLAHTAEARPPLRDAVAAACIIAGRLRGGQPEPVCNPAAPKTVVGTARNAAPADVDDAVASAKRSVWLRERTPAERAACLVAAADRLEARMPEFMDLCVAEAGKTLPDAVAEVREAVDFCRYYAAEAQRPRLADRAPLGVVACISPWNFPLAIFLGQVTGALAAGNAVVAKPAEQTPLIAFKAVQLLHEAGVPSDALHLVLGEGAVGAHLTGHRDVAGVCFTGSTATAQRIAAGLADSGRPLAPLIAETGGVNAMVVDSTALLEQAVQDVIASAFQSAGQRCSACRLVCVQDDIAGDFIRMLSGAMEEVSVGDPARLATDVGPLIDAPAHAAIAAYVDEMRTRWPVVGEAPAPSGVDAALFVRPVAFEVNAVGDVAREVFGPVLHLVRFAGHDLQGVIDAVNGLGFGLTMGLHTRIDARVDRVAARARVGNLYVNRNQIGAVVGVQPFGGEGLSGTGPKAGGPHYVLALTRPRGEAIDEQASAAPSLAPVNRIDTLQLIKQAHAAQAGWAACDRASALRDWSGAAGMGDVIAPILKLAAAPGELPGPTGEANTLTLHPRGVLACWGGDDPGDLERQIAAALASGAGVIAVKRRRSHDGAHALMRALATAEAPAGLVSFMPADAAAALLDAPIDGVIAEGAVRAAIADRVRRRDGASVPLLSWKDDPERYFRGRTVTINTSAAGGDAALLAIT